MQLDLGRNVQPVKLWRSHGGGDCHPRQVAIPRALVADGLLSGRWPDRIRLKPNGVEGTSGLMMSYRKKP